MIPTEACFDSKEAAEEAIPIFWAKQEEYKGSHQLRAKRDRSAGEEQRVSKTRRMPLGDASGNTANTPLNLANLGVKPPPVPETTIPQKQKKFSIFDTIGMSDEICTVLRTAEAAKEALKERQTNNKPKPIKRKNLGRKKVKSNRGNAQSNAQAVAQARRIDHRNKRDSQLQGHIDHLYYLIASGVTYTLLIDYDDSIPVEEQYTRGQIEYCDLQCRALHHYFHAIVCHNTGEVDSWTLRSCADYASALTFGKASARTIQSWYLHSYLPNKSHLVPNMKGQYERDSFVEWFVMQDDLLTSFINALKNNVKEMSYARAYQILNNVLKREYEYSSDISDGPELTDESEYLDIYVLFLNFD